MKKLNDELREKLIASLESAIETTASTEPAFKTALKPLLTGVGIATPVQNAIFKACMVRDADATPLTDSKGRRQPDMELRDNENVPLSETVEDFLTREVSPFVGDAWVSDPDGTLGYEIPFTKLFYRYTPPRSLADIDAEIKASQQRILKLIGEVSDVD